MMRKLLMGVTLGLISVGIYAQPKVLTFDDAVKIAIRNGLLLNQQ